MPNVTALPKSGSDGKIQREFYDVVGTTSTTYTYPSTQLGISVKNLGTANLTLTISGESKTIQPKKTESYSGSFTSFAIVAASGLVSFFADAYELDNDNPNVKLTSLTADVANLKSGGVSGDGMLLNKIPGTTPVTVMENGKPKTVTWKNTSNAVLRTDTYTWTATSLTEVRSLSTGETITITTDLSKSPPETTYSAITK